MHDSLGKKGHSVFAERIAEARTSPCVSTGSCPEIHAEACDLLQVSSAFSQLLNLHNLSEEISSAQLERAVRMGEARAHGPKNLCPDVFGLLYTGDA